MILVPSMQKQTHIQPKVFGHTKALKYWLKSIAVEVKDLLRASMEWGVKKAYLTIGWQYLYHRYLLIKEELEENFDGRYGTDTFRKVRLSQYDAKWLRCSDAVMYWATPVQIVKKTLGSLGINKSQYIFIDAGCGKGRVALIASSDGFKEVKGIEMNPFLLDVARDNRNRYRQFHQQLSPTAFFCDNALEHEYEAENMVLFMFKPFGSASLSILINKLITGMSQNHFDLMVIMVDPEDAHIECIERFSFALMSSSKTQSLTPTGTYSWFIYRYEHNT